jgi:hypothetical protein
MAMGREHIDFWAGFTSGKPATHDATLDANHLMLTHQLLHTFVDQLSQIRKEQRLCHVLCVWSPRTIKAFFFFSRHGRCGR